MKQLLIFSLLIGFGGGACRKQMAEPVPGCDYTTKFSNLITSTYTYRFNAANRLTSLLYNNGNPTEYVYAYQGSKATIDYEYQSIFNVKVRYALTLNEQGYVVAAQKTNLKTQTNGTVETSIEAIHTFSYDADGRLTTHRREQFRYPVGDSKKTTTYQEQFTYQNGNPVTITYSNQGDDVAKMGGPITNTYGTPANLLKIPLQLEAGIDGNFNLDPALQPLLGKPPGNLLDRSDESREYDFRTDTYSNRYVYQLGAQGQVIQATRQPGAPDHYYVRPPIFAFDNHCP